ncbi:50S ribosomal protein L24 [Erysipelotrichaceae bacterium RD49]|nr:50S ribosomal protein L24 [Erysipelotrichaceae bacterium RD49]
MKIKKGDKVQVMTGAYKGTVGEVLTVFPKENKVIVEGVNIVKKHQKPTQANPDGGIIEKEAKIHVSNVALYDEKAKEAGRVGYKMTTDKDGKEVKVRYFKKSGNEIKDKK